MNNSNHAGWKRTFFIIWSGQAISLFGSELVQFALVWFLTRQTGSASVLAMASFVALLPRVLISPFIGALIDRWNRQRVMIFADLFIAGFTLVLAVIFWQNRVQVWHIYAIMFIRALGSSFHWPAMQSSTSLMVPKDQLARISGMNQTLQGILGILAPMTAALLLDILPMQGMLAIDILTALIAITPLLFVVIPQPVKNEGVTPYAGIGGLIRDVKEGFRYLANWKGMMVLTIAATLLNFLLNPGFTFTPLLVTQHFGKGAVELSLVEAVFSFGMIAGGIMLSVWGGFKRRIMTTLSGIMGIAVSTAIIAVAKPSEFLWAAAGMGVTGFMMPITNGPISAIMQAHVEPEIQGRVFTMTNSLMSAMIPVSMLVAAPVAEWIGIRGWVALASAGCLVIGITCFCVPELMDVENPLSKKRN
jgi:DHA3 family macrolide efflux protein-like MFS transporter